MSDRSTEEKTLLSSTAVTASTQTASMFVGSYTESCIFLDVTAVTGTAPRLIAQVQISHDDTDWFDVAGAVLNIFTDENYLLRVKNTAKFIRLNLTVSGTSPSFTMEIIAQAKN